MTTQTPRAVFFDLDETLIENVIPIPDLFARMYDDFDSQLGAAQKAQFFATLRTNAADLWSSMFLREESPEAQFTACFAKSLQALNILDEAESNNLAEQMFAHFLKLSSLNTKLHAGAVETLATLRDDGFITGIITNGIEQLQLGKIHRLALEDKVDHVVVSAQARAHKPHKPVFDLALSRARVQSHEAWQIGDHATNDVAGAIRAGMGGVFFDPSRKRVHTAFADLEVRPTHVINNLAEVLELV